MLANRLNCFGWAKCPWVSVGAGKTWREVEGLKFQEAHGAAAEVIATHLAELQLFSKRHSYMNRHLYHCSLSGKHGQREKHTGRKV